MPPTLSRKERTSAGQPAPGARPRGAAWVLPALFAALVLLVLGPAPHVLDEDDLYPLRSDSAEYDKAGAGAAAFLAELPAALPKLVSGGLSPEDRERYDWNSGLLQHAASYVGLLGVTYASFGHDPLAGRWLTIVLSAASAALLVAWSRAHFGRAAAALAGVLFLVWPAHVYFGTAIMTEMPMVFFVLLAVFALERTRRAPAALVALGGALLGFAILSKYSYRFVVVPFLLLDLWERGATHGWTGWWRFLGWRFAGVLVVLAAWGGFLRLADLPAAPLASGFETELFLFRGNYPEDRGFECVGLGDASVPPLIEAARAHRALPKDERTPLVYRTALRKAIGEEPSRWAALVWAKAGWFWRYPGEKRDVPGWFGSLPPPARLQLVVVALGFLGLAACAARGTAGFLPAMVVLYLTALHAGTHLVSRYNVPALALLLPYSAAGMVAIAGAVRSRAWAGVDRRDRILLGSAALAGLLAFAGPRDIWVSLGAGPVAGFAIATALVFAVAVLLSFFLLRRTRGAGLRGARALALPLVPLLAGLALLGDAHADRDSDVWRAPLSRAGDRITQKLLLPENIEWRAVANAEVLIDMEASPGSEPDLVVRVNGSEVRRMENGLVNPEEDYRVDEKIHAVQKRYERVRTAYETRLEDSVRRRWPDADLTYFRQWFRVPVPLETIAERAEVVIEIELLDPGGGTVTVFGDAVVEPAIDAESPARRIEAPAFLENPYELSTYQFFLFATDRERADVRLTRPQRLLSLSAEGRFERAGAALENDLGPRRGAQRGEYRVRLRTRLEGAYVRRTEEGGKSQVLWAVWPKPGDVVVGPDDLRVLSSRRDTFFDGWRTY